MNISQQRMEWCCLQSFTLESDWLSLQLFSGKVFKLDQIISGYDKLAFDILKHANHLQLAIKVLGSLLFGQDIYVYISSKENKIPLFIE
jgi:hypothetical protein